MSQSFKIPKGAIFPYLTLKCEQRNEDGEWEPVQGLTGATVKFTMIDPAATIDADSAAAQKVVYVDDTSYFSAGDKIIIGRGRSNEENGVIASIQDGVSITLATNLSKAHLFDDIESVHIIKIDDEDGEVADDVKALVRYKWAAGDTNLAAKLYPAKMHITMVDGKTLTIPMRDQDELFVEILADV